MTSAVRKCPEEGDIPCLCTSAEMVAMQTKGLPPPRGVLPGPEVYKVPMNGKQSSGAQRGVHTKHLGARRAWVSRGPVSGPKALGRI